MLARPRFLRLLAIGKGLIAPAAGVVIFIALWGMLAPQLKTSLGILPGPGEVWSALLALMEEHAAARAEATAAVAAGDVYPGGAELRRSDPHIAQDGGNGLVLASLVTVLWGWSPGCRAA